MTVRLFVYVALMVLGAVMMAPTVQDFYTHMLRRALLAAAFLNDSEVIQFTDSSTRITTGGESVVQTGTDTSAPTPSDPSTTNTQNNTQTNSSDSIITFSNSSSGQLESTGETSVVSSVSISSSDGPLDPAASPSETVSASETNTVSAENILSSLIGSQAVVASSGGGVSDVGAVYIYADRVRESFRARGIGAFSIPNANTLIASDISSSQRLTRNDFSLFVSSAILKDEALRDVSFTGGVLKTEYRALGRLFGVVPITYTLRVALTFSTDGTATITVRFPWYRFFLATGVSRSVLEKSLTDAVNNRRGDGQGDFDSATKAFIAIAEVLKNRVGTSA